MKTAVVIGAGTMGAGIAEVLARAGLQTTLCDRELALAEAGLEKVRTSLARAVQKGKLESAEPVLTRLQAAQGVGPVADLVVEAVFEDLELKKSLLGELSRRSEVTLLGSNTSSLSLTEIASACQVPERVIGLHFFNPAPVMALLEVVRAEQTSTQTLDRALELALRLGKTPVVVRDVAGFATSRLGILLGMEAIRMVESQVASAADIDRAMELGYRHPMGPLKLTDLVGLDVRLAIAEHLTKEIGPQFAPPPLLRRLVRAGYLGKKTGRGFYRWEGDQAVEDC